MPTFYQEQLQRKRPWEVRPVPKLPFVEEAAKTLTRALALRVLELEVKDWLEQGLKKEELPSDVVGCLRSNQQDEEKHDQILSCCAKTYGLVSEEDDKTAQELHCAWVTHPDHPIVKAAVLESSVFFVILPILRTFGGVGLALVSADISGDESVHAAVHRHLAAELGHSYSSSLDKLRKETVAWMVNHLSVPEAGRLGKPNHWLNASDSLLERGVSDLVETRRGVMPAFFEIPNHALPSYA